MNYKQDVKNASLPSGHDSEASKKYCDNDSCSEQYSTSSNVCKDKFSYRIGKIIGDLVDVEMYISENPDAISRKHFLAIDGILYECGLLVDRYDSQARCNGKQNAKKGQSQMNNRAVGVLKEIQRQRRNGGQSK